MVTAASPGSIDRTTSCPEPGLARGARRYRPAALLRPEDVAEDGVSVGAGRLVAEYIAAIQVLNVVAAAERFDQVGQARARDGVLLQVPGQLPADGLHDDLGLRRRHLERRSEIGHGRPALHVPQGIVHLHADPRPLPFCFFGGAMRCRAPRHCSGSRLSTLGSAAQASEKRPPRSVKTGSRSPSA
jgi:hypothetical protein